MKVNVSGVEVGGGSLVIMAGPCAIESEVQILRTAEFVARSGARILRGGAFKPRTSPYSFQGLGEPGLRLLFKARQETGLRIVTEVMSPSQVSLVAAYADMVQVGSRNMANPALLSAVARCGRPVLLKRGMSATVEEYAEAALAIVGMGNPDVILCERGIRTYGTATRNTCDIAAIPLLQRITGLPVILDPSHATGVTDLVSRVSCAGIAIGADGLIIEVHPDPASAWSDGDQSLTFEQFRDLLDDTAAFREIWAARRAQQCEVAVGA